MRFSIIWRKKTKKQIDMKIIQECPNSFDRMYCPSTDEVIFSPNYLGINDNAKAYIASWDGEALEEPLINNSELNAVWLDFYSEWDELMKEFNTREAVERFLKYYKSENWIVYECTFSGLACGPIAFTIYYVVQADTIIEEDPETLEEL